MLPTDPIGFQSDPSLTPGAAPDMPSVLIDPDSRSLDHRFAVIRTPKRNRARYPEGCVTVTEDEDAARAGACPEKNLYPAEVYGPSVSSESQRIYYLVRWLE